MSDDIAREKWDSHYSAADLPEAATVLRDNAHLLPKQGTALDIACGLGANSIVLAEHGLETHAWDISPVAVERLRAYAVERGLPIIAAAKDVQYEALPPAQFDVIVVAHFLDRRITPALLAALKVGGLLFYQTFTRTAVSDAGPHNEEWRLADGELLSMFAPLRPLVYREEGRVGDVTRGFRDKALLVAVKESDRSGDCLKAGHD